MDALTYHSGRALEARGLDIIKDSLWMMLLNDVYKFDAGHARRSELLAAEIGSGFGYAAGGKPILGRSLVWLGDTLQVKADNVVWPRSSIKARHGVVYRARGGDADKDDLVCCFDFGENKASMNGPFAVEWPGGVMREY